MDPGIYNVALGANVDFARELYVKLDGAPLDFTTWIGFQFQVRVQPGQSGAPLINIVGDGPDLTVYPADGRLSLRIPRALLDPLDTGNPLGFRRLYHELIGVQSDGRRDKFFYGNFDLYPGVVR